MHLLCWSLGGLLTLATASVAASTWADAQNPPEFPLGTELRMDARPIKGSKRVPFMEISINGNATIDLWCNSVQGQFVVAADTVTVLIGPKTSRECTPEQTQADDDLLDALQQATHWKREGDGVVLTGTRPLGSFHRRTSR